MIALAVVIIIIVVIAGAGIVLNGKDERISLQVGYFLTYQSWNSGNGNYTTTYEILGVNSSNIFYEVTYDYYEWQQSDYSPNSTSYYNISNEVSIFPWDANVEYYHNSTYWKYLGTETMDTKWGKISTDHYAVGEEFDDWIYHGISMKIDQHFLSHSSPARWMFILVDTNIPNFTGLNTSLEVETR
jgi:hypothetical protein